MIPIYPSFPPFHVRRKTYNYSHIPKNTFQNISSNPCIPSNISINHQHKNNNKNHVYNNTNNYSNLDNYTINQTTKENDNKNDNENNDIGYNQFFEIFGIKLYFDDLLILALLFFLYKEEVKDSYLYIILFMLLLS